MTKQQDARATLIFSPLNRDAEVIAEAIAANGPTRICRDAEELAAALAAEGDAAPLGVILSEEASSETTADRLIEALGREPTWSYLPLLFLVASAGRPPPALRRVSDLPEPPPFIVQERPLNSTVLARINATQIAHRRRQFETADLLARLEEAESRQRFLLAELNHRTRNMLAVLQGIFKMTARQSDDVRTLTDRFADRMDSIVTAHAALTEEGYRERDLARLLREHVDPYCRDADQLRLEGEEVLISSKRSFELSMIVHELATNSAKYGALSVTEGHVDVSWRALPERWLEIAWEESGGPPVDPPGREGLGTQLIRGGSFGARIETELDYARGGLVWRARLDVD